MTDIPGRRQLSGYLLRDYDDLIARLNSARQSQGVLLAELAARVGVSPQAVAWQLGGQPPRDGLLVFEIARALGLGVGLIPEEKA